MISLMSTSTAPPAPVALKVVEVAGCAESIGGPMDEAAPPDTLARWARISMGAAPRRRCSVEQCRSSSESEGAGQMGRWFGPVDGRRLPRKALTERRTFNVPPFGLRLDECQLSDRAPV